jgi:hypothetical protein
MSAVLNSALESWGNLKNFFMQAYFFRGLKFGRLLFLRLCVDSVRKGRQARLALLQHEKQYG